MIKCGGDGAEEDRRPRSFSDRESDGGDESELLSHYSSFGGDESELDRYCSANSAMGTPCSFKSSTSFQDYYSDFGSLKSFKLGGENTVSTKFGAPERRLSEFNNDRMDSGTSTSDRRMEGFVLGGGNEGNNVVERLDLDDDDRGVVGGIDGVVEETKLLLDDEGEVSGYGDEHSEGDDSMYGCGSDDERKVGLYYGKEVVFKDRESGRGESQLVMNSSVAFGNDDWDDFVQESGGDANSLMGWGGITGERQVRSQSGVGSLSFTAAASSLTHSKDVLEERQGEVRSAPVTYNGVGSGGKLAEVNVETSSMNSANLVRLDAWVEDRKGEVASSNQVSDIDEFEKYIGFSSGYDIFQKNKDPPTKGGLANELKIGQTESEVKNQDAGTGEEVMTVDLDNALRNMDLGKTIIEPDPLSESVGNHHHLVPVKDKEDSAVKLLQDHDSVVQSSLGVTTTSATTKSNFAFAFDQIEDHFVPFKTKNYELNGFYDEIVNDMEDVLLDSGESNVSRFTHGTRIHQSQLSRPSRDGGSSASTSGTDYAYNRFQQPLRIDKVEVVGSRQKKGDVSFSERLVGVQKYTVYRIRVWSGDEHWEVERRYRDFSTLYQRLKKLFTEHSWTLPSPWSSVERESRKLFGNASQDVIADRTVLIQECLQSLIHPDFSSSSLNALFCFLSPSEGMPDSPASSTGISQAQLHNRGSQMENFSSLGKTISLVVQIRPFKSMKQMLDAQHYRCAGCHKNFDDGRTRVLEFVQTLGWGKPRLCEYSGQLFCSSCHNNDTAILPARVLHYWDFTWYPVSQLAKSFLDSINDQPMLCVSAVNPFLFSKVPTLQHVANIRNRIRAMLPYVRCPFRRSIYKGLGSRRYLLDSNDFFALRDLVDLSKGMFSALPVMVETVSRKIEEHITEQCLVCYDVGVPCSARQDCNNPTSLIFPFQEGEVKRCKSCDTVFHKNCFKKIASCSCGARFKPEEVKQIADKETHNVGSSLNLVRGTSESSSGLLAGLFSKMMPSKSQISRKQDLKDNDNVIVMGSLPSTSL